MVSFHHDSQRLAVGSTDNIIVIYDLKTASRWHVLEGHKQAVSAVAFSDNGKVLSSYSINDASVRIWMTGTSFFGILGSRPPCVKQFPVSKPSSMILPLSSFSFLFYFCSYYFLQNRLHRRCSCRQYGSSGPPQPRSP